MFVLSLIVNHKSNITQVKIITMPEKSIFTKTLKV